MNLQEIIMISSIHGIISMLINIKKALILGSLLLTTNIIIANDSDDDKLDTSTYGNQGAYPEAIEERRYNDIGSLTGDKSVKLGTNSDIAKNYDKLWQASIDATDFAPISTAKDGIIVTEWYSINSKPNEQFKASINIKKDSGDIEVRVFSKDKKSSAEKTGTPQTNQIANEIKNKILAKVASK